MSNTPNTQASAKGVLQALAARQADLVSLIEQLEQHMTTLILDQPIAPDPEVVETVQSLDLVRQSCGDTARLLSLVAEHAEWDAKGAPEPAAFHAAVDMERSLDGIIDAPDIQEDPPSETSTLKRDACL